MSESRDEKETAVDPAVETGSTPDAQKKPVVDSPDDAATEIKSLDAAASFFSGDGAGESGLEMPSLEAMGLAFPESAASDPSQDASKNAIWDRDKEPELPPSAAFEQALSEPSGSDMRHTIADREPQSEPVPTDRRSDTASVAAPTSLVHAEEPPAERKLDELVAKLDGEIASSYGPLLGPDVDSAASESESEVAKERYLLFTLDQTFWAVPIGAIVEVESVPAITSVPNVPSWILGVANMRGDIVSVADFKELLGLGATLAPERGRIVIGKSTREGMIVGLVVDDVNGFVRLAKDEVSTPSAHSDSVITPFLLGVCEHKDALVSILDLGRFLDSRSVRQFEPV